ncbi:MAG: DUF3309 domain-containing protein [Candidatus Manganitrophus sp.]|nr:DUF3309 domain-containing protein [Candidatus Manganitrophus sp.]WDT73160.1 MAG: DUF3309 domain-containing protein [Candidatus Manganitrophus sp.]
MSTILIVLLVLLLIGALPAWPYSANWGYGPTGGGIDSSHPADTGADRTPLRIGDSRLLQRATF